MSLEINTAILKLKKELRNILWISLLTLLWILVLYLHFY